jgi:magnesium-transporting ATPase (P-type)
MFSLQQFGTNKVGFMFAPVVLTWFISIGLIGVYNIVSNDPSVFRALNPLYIISYFHRNKVEAWKSLGGIVLCITGKCLDKIFELCSVWCALLKLAICALLYSFNKNAEILAANATV